IAEQAWRDADLHEGLGQLREQRLQRAGNSCVAAFDGVPAWRTALSGHTVLLPQGPSVFQTLIQRVSAEMQMSRQRQAGAYFRWIAAQSASAPPTALGRSGESL